MRPALDPVMPSPSGRTWVGFSAMCVGMFMAILDVQIVATSLPTIQDALGISPDQMSWIQTAYLVAEVVAIPLTGALTRVLTMRWLFVSATSAFTLASVGCASSTGLDSLVAWRVLQGFAGGTLIPAVFAAVFLLFPVRQQVFATTVGGVLAVMAPTVGPVVGGWITGTFSWHWLFLLNVLPGIAAALTAARLLPAERPRPDLIGEIDVAALALMAAGLATLEIGLKEAPQRGWAAPVTIALLVGSLACLAVFVRRTLRSRHPLVELRTLARPGAAAGCALSFACGVGLFGSVYLMPVFLGLVRGHDAFGIGRIMLVTGIAQLVTAPVAVLLERRYDARLLSALGFGVFALGSAASAFQTPETDFAGMIWPQILRGASVMFCLLPPTRMVLDGLVPIDVPDASGLFNLMRNLGGAIGLALIDTVIYGRAPGHAETITAQLTAGDRHAATFVGIPLHVFEAHAGQPVDESTRAILAPLVERAAATLAMNDAWAIVAILSTLAIGAIAWAPRLGPPSCGGSSEPGTTPGVAGSTAARVTSGK